MIAKKAETPLVLLLLLALCLFFFWQTLTPDAEDRVIFAPGDFTHQFCAFASYESDRITSGELPLWDPYSNAGTPFHADPQVAAFYPLRWALIGLVGSEGLTCRELQYEVIFHVWLISALAYLFLKEIMAHKSAALIGAILFTYAGYQMSYPILSFSVLEASAWLPLMLLGVTLSIEKEKPYGMPLVGLGLGLSLLAGHPQTTLYITGLAAIYLITTARARQLSWQVILLRVGLFSLIGAALGAIQLLPSIELLSQTTRYAIFDYDIKGNGYLFGDLMGVIWPNLGQWSPLYFGTAGLILAGGAAARMGKRERFWLAAVIVAFGLAFGKHGALYDAFYAFVPVIGSMFRSQERITIVIVMSMAVLAAYQVDWLLSNPAGDDDARRVKSFKLGALIFSGVLAAVLIARVIPGTEPLALNNAVFVALMALLFILWLLWRDAAKPGIRSASALLAAVIVFDLFTVGMNATNSFAPDEPASYESAPLAWSTLRAPDEVLWHVDGSWGVQGRGLFTRVPDIYTTSPIELASIAALRELPVDRMWEVLAVRYVTMSDEIVLPESLQRETIKEGLNYSDQEITVYELTDPRPMAHLIYDAMVVDDPVFARQIMADSTVHLREFAVISEALSFELPGQRPDDADITNLSNPQPERYEMRVSTSQNALLTMAVPAYAGWKASVDGADTPIITTYTGLIGIPIAAGEDQQVVLSYQPMTLIVGAVISGAAVVSLLAWAIWLVMIARKKRLGGANS